MKKIVLLIGLILSVNSFATPYSLEGYTVDAYMERVTDPYGYGLGRIKGYGLDAPFQVHTGTDDIKKYSSVFNLNIDKDKFTIDFLMTAGWQDGTVFRIVQPDYASTTGAGFWSGLGSDTNIDGLKFGQGIDIGPGWVSLNFSNTHFTQDSYFIGYFNYQDYKEQVPEPLPYMLLIPALLVISLKRYSLKK